MSSKAIEPANIESTLTGAAAMALLDTPGVTGIGAGVCEAGSVNAINPNNCIVIYLSETAGPGLINELPDSLEGFSVVIRTGGSLSIDSL